MSPTSRETFPNAAETGAISQSPELLAAREQMASAFEHAPQPEIIGQIRLGEAAVSGKTEYTRGAHKNLEIDLGQQVAALALGFGKDIAQRRKDFTLAA